MRDKAVARGAPLVLEHVGCPLCGRTDSEPIGVGEDFEYRTSPDTFLAMQCPNCDVVYLDPRPASCEMGRVYPANYHAFAFTEADYGLVHTVRSRLEARRLLQTLRGVPRGAHIVDVGCGDGFHLDLLQRHGRPDWQLAGVDSDPRAVEAARRRGLTVHHGSVETAPFEEESFDVAFLIQTIEHVAHPLETLRAVRKLLKPGGRLVVVTDNTGSLDFRLFRRRHWGGYHFPRHFTLFDRTSLSSIGAHAGFEVEKLGTLVSPVTWTFSVRNVLDDHRAPDWLTRQFSLTSPLALGVFTVVDAINQVAGRGALLRAEMRKAR